MKNIFWSVVIGISTISLVILGYLLYCFISVLNML